MVSKRLRGYIAVAIPIAFFVIVILFCSLSSITFQDMIKNPEPEPRTAIIPLSFSLEQTASLQTNSDVNCTLSIYIPNGTLYTNNNITITSQVALSQKAVNVLQSIEVGFQNSLQYPLMLDNNNMPLSGILHLGNFGNAGNTGVNFTDANGNHIFIGEIIGFANPIAFEDTRSVFWSIDGNYKAIFYLTYKNGTSTTLLSDSTVMHVYPEEQLSQLTTSQLAVALAFVGLLIGVISVFSLAVQIADGGNDVCNYPKDGTSKPDGNSKPKERFYNWLRKKKR